MTKVVDEKIDEGVLRWFGHVERVENDRIVRRVYLGECAGSRSVGRARKRWIGTVKEYLRKGGLDARPSRRMVHDRSVWQGFVRENTTVVSCPGDMKPLNGGSCSSSSLQFNSIKGKGFFVLF